MPTNYVNMVENRAIRQAKYKALTSSYQAGGRDQQPTSTVLRRLDKAIARETVHVTGRNLWSFGKAKYSDMVAQ